MSKAMTGRGNKNRAGFQKAEAKQVKGMANSAIAKQAEGIHNNASISKLEAEKTKAKLRRAMPKKEMCPSLSIRLCQEL